MSRKYEGGLGAAFWYQFVDTAEAPSASAVFYSEPRMVCPKCGRRYKLGRNTCPKCGGKLNRKEVQILK